MIAATEAEQEQVRRLVHSVIPGADIIIFGSRVTGSWSPTSDLDIALSVPAGTSIWDIEAVREALMASTLPFRTDVVDLDRLDPKFRRIVEQTGQRLD
jgi:predicted nucleotidyltransferase